MSRTGPTWLPVRLELSKPASANAILEALDLAS